MEPERWRQVEELYHSALEVAADRRTEFLKDACGDDEALRHEVESLLAYERSAEGFFEEPALEVAGRLMAHDEPSRARVDPVLAGRTLSHYRVLEKLGGGGMGVVYKAEDLRLGRRVALKFLPDELATDPAALKRFEREARAASALNHPNICTIHNIEEYEEKLFIVMELLEGQTLRELISAASPGKPPLELEKLVALAIQVTEGLGAAHRQGIVHRDIKPANIFVTTQGQAKILDFGLAKLVPAVAAAGAYPGRDHRDDDGALGTPRETVALATSDPLLSRTGVAMGTAGYMSPEQVRGEKLDARTDLFSFGLVLYEMATGKRAFRGDAGPVLQEAILKLTPSPARELNPELPSKLEKVIRRALEKDREARYQSASDMRADLENLREDMQPASEIFRRWAATTGVIALVLVAAVFWYSKRPPSTVPDLKLRQLTLNSVENPVTSGAISPDGKYLAYADAKGMHIQLVDTGEAHAVPQPDSRKGTKVDWEVSAWFPDSTRFLANAHPGSEGQSAWSSQTSSIWMVPAQGGAPRKLRDNAVAWSVSPDGSSISFGTNKGRLGEREIWLMGPNEEPAHKLYEVGENNAICCLYFFPNRRRVSYITSNESGDTAVSRDLTGGPPTIILPPSEMKNVNDAAWLPDGRLIYSMREPQVVGDTCNYWAMRLDTRTGQTIEKPKRLTNWAGFCMDNTSVTADGKRLTFKKWTTHASTYVADLEAGGTRLLSPRHFTLSESLDDPGDWTADSKTLIFGSNRNGHWNLYKQALDEDQAEPVLAESDAVLNSRVSPDGNWILYQHEVRPGDPAAPREVMRIPVTGGTPQLVFTTRPGSFLFCARAPAKVCAIAEPAGDHKQVVITAFDPLKGRGAELTKFDVDPSMNDWPGELSPDGTRFAAITSPGGPINILSLRGQGTQVLKVKGWSNPLQTLYWAADGKALFAISSFSRDAVLLHVDLHGNAHKLRDHVAVGDSPASPDGRHLAFMSQTADGNMWTMENF